MASTTAKPTARKPPARPAASRAPRPAPITVVLLVATRKGAWLFHGDTRRKAWRVDGPHFLGHEIHHLQLDPRDGRTLLAAAKTGHLGPTIFRSTNLGRSWKEAVQPPAFAKVAEGAPGPAARAVNHSFWLTPGHASERDTWYAGTSPQGLFRSTDGGVTWAPFSSINDDPQYREWMGTHLLFAMSGGGVHESRDGGQTWSPLVKGLQVVEGFDPSTITFHDPHCVRLCPSNPDRLYQQNHCGIYRLDRPGDTWQRIGGKMPKRVGDIGFPMVVHPRDDQVAWVFPMDGNSVWPRTSPQGRPAAYVTRNAGRTWQRQDSGLPADQAWWTVKRQAMTADAADPVGVYFGTTSGELWASRDEGQRWSCIARHLPAIYAVEAAALG